MKFKDFVFLTEKIEHIDKERYTKGGCGYLAMAFHELYGWDVYAEVGDQDRMIHVWAKNKSGKAVDIMGVHPTNYAKLSWYSYPKDETFRIKEMDPKVMKRWGYEGPDLDRAIEIINNNKKYFGVK